MKHPLSPAESERLAGMHADIASARREIKRAKEAIRDLEGEASNNVYDSIEDAESCIEEALNEKASSDCEGSYNCGLDTYEQMFMVDGAVYQARLHVDYNRHDKRYYYVDGTTFETVKVST